MAAPKHPGGNVGNGHPLLAHIEFSVALEKGKLPADSEVVESLYHRAYSGIGLTAAMPSIYDSATTFYAE